MAIQQQVDFLIILSRYNFFKRAHVQHDVFVFSAKIWELQRRRERSFVVTHGDRPRHSVATSILTFINITHNNKLATLSAGILILFKLWCRWTSFKIRSRTKSILVTLSLNQGFTPRDKSILNYRPHRRSWAMWSRTVCRMWSPRLSCPTTKSAASAAPHSPTATFSTNTQPSPTVNSPPSRMTKG